MSRDQFANVPMNKRFADVQDEHRILLAAIREIANADSCSGAALMNSIANDTMRQILEARADAKARARAQTRIDHTLKGALAQ